MSAEQNDTFGQIPSFMRPLSMMGHHRPLGAPYVQYEREFNKRCVEVERFFAQYIETLASIGDQRQGDKEAMSDITDSAILTAMALRETALRQLNSHLFSKDERNDPFFKRNSVPLLRPVHGEDFTPVTTVPLPEYLNRLAIIYPTIQVSRNLIVGELLQITVGLSDVVDDAHYLIMPRPEVFLDIIGKSQLFLLQPATQQF